MLQNNEVIVSNRISLILAFLTDKARVVSIYETS